MIIAQIISANNCIPVVSHINIMAPVDVDIYIIMPPAIYMPVVNIVPVNRVIIPFNRVIVPVNRVIIVVVTDPVAGSTIIPVRIICCRPLHIGFTLIPLNSVLPFGRRRALLSGSLLRRARLLARLCFTLLSMIGRRMRFSSSLPIAIFS
jgi:hypothetical protein